jgi:hypothetical protein
MHTVEIESCSTLAHSGVIIRQNWALGELRVIGLENHILSSIKRSWKFRNHVLIGMIVMLCTLCKYWEAHCLTKLRLIFSRRYDFLVSVLYPTETNFARCMWSTPLANSYNLTEHRAWREMRVLVEKFPDGLQEQHRPVEKDYYHQPNVTKHSGEIELDPG